MTEFIQHEWNLLVLYMFIVLYFFSLFSSILL